MSALLSSVMESLVSPVQSTFIKGINFVDGVLMVNEVVDLVKKNRKECIIFKVVLEKVYDSFGWSFLDYMSERFGFDHRWRSWIRVCFFLLETYMSWLMGSRHKR